MKNGISDMKIIQEKIKSRLDEAEVQGVLENKVEENPKTPSQCSKMKNTQKE